MLFSKAARQRDPANFLPLAFSPSRLQPHLFGSLGEVKKCERTIKINSRMTDPTSKKGSIEASRVDLEKRAREHESLKAARRTGSDLAGLDALNFFEVTPEDRRSDRRGQLLAPQSRVSRVKTHITCLSEGFDSGSGDSTHRSTFAEVSKVPASEYEPLPTHHAEFARQSIELRKGCSIVGACVVPA
ncbi:hypothetical protein LshimejAT787_1700090 [Lyophyllum shimeji]|uniref:Uncharacterized protein n=1 Tax=Lyophyllum shimeji TaxID=47721 RepID=A0A9P3UTN9_LYOSH|nr:hypothetical protein LshimejAT787_1700090 [Lyophyllum shimeji]